MPLAAEISALPTKSTKTTSFKYIKPDPSYATVKPYRLNKFTPPEDANLPVQNFEFEVRDGTRLTDLRGKDNSLPELDLVRDGFKFYHYPTEHPVTNTTEKLKAYCEESIKLIKKELQSEHVIAYEVLYRHRDAKTAKSVNKNSMPIEMVHIDHTRDGGKFRIKHHLTEEEVTKYSEDGYRWRIVNIWRPLCDVVKDMPLAMLDPRSVDPSDIMETDQVGPHYSGEICYLKHNDGHRWYWLKDQTKDEVTMFVCYDTHPPSSYLNCCPHASFTDPDIPDGMPPRESVELRFVVLSKI